MRSSFAVAVSVLRSVRIPEKEISLSREKAGRSDETRGPVRRRSVTDDNREDGAERGATVQDFRSARTRRLIFEGDLRRDNGLSSLPLVATSWQRHWQTATLAVRSIVGGVNGGWNGGTSGAQRSGAPGVQFRLLSLAPYAVGTEFRTVEKGLRGEEGSKEATRGVGREEREREKGKKKETRKARKGKTDHVRAFRGETSNAFFGFVFTSPSRPNSLLREYNCPSLSLFLARSFCLCISHSLPLSHSLILPAEKQILFRVTEPAGAAV